MQEFIKKHSKTILVSAIILIILVAMAVFSVSRSFKAQIGLSPGMAPAYDSGSFNDFGLGAAIGEMGDAIQSSTRSNNKAVFEESRSGSDGNDWEGGLTTKKIIKNGSLTLYVKDAEAAAQDIQALAISLEGFVSESNIYKSADGIKRGSIVIRIPAKSFEEALHNVKQLAEEVENESLSSQDVTEQYVDLDAQLRNLRAEEAQYLNIMQKSITINDTLSVANRLSNVRGQIERIQGQLNYLSRQVDMSTIRITLSADADIEVFGIRWRPLIVIKRSFKSMLEDLSRFADGLIAFIFKLPVVILTLATIIFFAWLALKLLVLIYHRFFKKHLKPDNNEQS